MTDYQPSTDEDRAMELQLRNSIALVAYYNRRSKLSPAPRVSVQAWHRFLAMRQFYGGFRRRHPINEPPKAA